MVVLLVAIFMSNSFLAAIAIGIAVAGSILLSRDWLSERRTTKTDAGADEQSDSREPEDDTSSDGLKPELFTPDVSYEEAVQVVDDDEDFDLEGN